MNLEVLEKDNYYHIFNRGIDGTSIFNTEENKRYFLELTGKYLYHKASISAYCLLDNHYHFLIKVNSTTNEITQAFSNL